MDTKVDDNPDTGSIKNSSTGCLELEEKKTEEIPTSPPPAYEFVLDEEPIEVEEESEDGGSIAPILSTAPSKLAHMSSKEIYKELAKEFGISCKMSDNCRCYNCQSHYFDCGEYEVNENEKTDGGLGAGTPMFLSEVMQGSACTLL